MFTLFVCDREQAEDFLENSTPAAVVSIHNPSDEPCRGFDKFLGSKISLSFKDTSPYPTGGDTEHATRVDVENLLTWAESLPGNEGVLLVHCNAGEGRAPAVAYILQCFFDGEDADEHQSWRTVLRGCAHTPLPNQHVVSLGDSLLERWDGMTDVIQNYNGSLLGDKVY